MSILSDLLLEVEKEYPNDSISQLRTLCEKIYLEEKSSFLHSDLEPKGPNIFLSLECPGRTKDEVAFICLEREIGNIFMFTLWTTLIDSTEKFKKPKRVKTLSTLEVSGPTEVEPKKVMISYLKAYKYVKGD